MNMKRWKEPYEKGAARRAEKQIIKALNNN